MTLIGHVTQSLTHADWKNQCWLALLVIAGIFCVIGVALWITVGMMVSNPPNGSKQINTILLPLLCSKAPRSMLVENLPNCRA